MKSKGVWKVPGKILDEVYVIGMILLWDGEAFLAVDAYGITADMFKSPTLRRIYQHLHDRYLNMFSVHLPEAHQSLKEAKLCTSATYLLDFIEHYDRVNNGGGEARPAPAPPKDPEIDWDGLAMLYTNFGVDKVNAWLRP